MLLPPPRLQLAAAAAAADRGPLTAGRSGCTPARTPRACPWCPPCSRGWTRTLQVQGSSHQQQKQVAQCGSAEDMRAVGYAAYCVQATLTLTMQRDTKASSCAVDVALQAFTAPVSWAWRGQYMAAPNRTASRQPRLTSCLGPVVAQLRVGGGPCRGERVGKEGSKCYRCGSAAQRLIVSDQSYPRNGA